MKNLYNSEFYAGQQATSRESANAIIPLLFRRFRPISVLDVGCGVGTWLLPFIEAGVTDCLGLDGSWVPEKDLVIPKNRFQAVDLATPPNLQRQFSMTLCLEVAEHLSPAAANPFVSFLTSTSPIIAFSAAVPGQGGTGHLNEQWQDYWCSLFEKRQFVPYDFVRKAIWNDPSVCWWYAQNLIVYVEKAHAQQLGIDLWSSAPLNLVHPRFLSEALLPGNLSMPTASRAILHGIKRSAKRLLSI